MVTLTLRLLWACLFLLPTVWRARELGHAGQSTWTVAGTTEIRNERSLDTAFSRLYPLAPSRPALPAIDFRHSRVLVIAIGTRPSGGYSARLDSARVVHDTAVINVGVVLPPKGCGVTTELTTPAVAIATPLTPAPYRIVLRERANTAQCY